MYRKKFFSVNIKIRNQYIRFGKSEIGKTVIIKLYITYIFKSNNI